MDVNVNEELHQTLVLVEVLGVGETLVYVGLHKLLGVSLQFMSKPTASSHRLH